VRVINPAATSGAAAGVNTLDVPFAAADNIGAAAVLGVSADTVQAIVTVGGAVVYNRIQPTNGLQIVTFENLPGGAGAQVTLRLAGSAPSLTLAMIGYLYWLGDTEGTPTVGIDDYSVRTTDAFGVTTVTPRDWSRTLSLRFKSDNALVDAVGGALAALRATPCLWIAGDGLDALAVYGLYKEWSLGLQLAGTSYFSLSLEGFPATERPSAPGGDPAPDSTSGRLQMVQPVTVTDAVLVASSLPENDAPAWDANGHYDKGASVIRAHRIYEALAENGGIDPTTDIANWLDAGPTNRWAAFDQALGTASTAQGALSFTLAPGAPVSGLAVMDARAASVRVQAPGYDHQMPLQAGAALFLDLATGFADQITVTLQPDASGVAAAGTILFGQLLSMGVIEDQPTAGIADYSVRTTDDFGITTVVPRAWAKTMQAKTLIRTEAVDMLVRRAAGIRATPVLWIGAAGVGAVTIYGFFSDFSVALDTNVSVCSLTVQGLSRAATVVPVLTSVSWPAVTDPDGTKPENGATVGAPAGTTVNGVPAEQVTKNINDLITKTDDLVATYGTTETAEQAKNAAEAAQLASEKAAENSEASATSSDGSATASAGSASVAGSKADAAGQSASAAHDSEVKAQGYSDDASTQAGVAEGAAASAGASAGAAQHTLTVTSAIGPGVLNQNPNFATYSTSPGAPDAWDGWDYGGGTPYQVPGLNGIPFSVRMDAGGDANCGIEQAIAAAAGKYVIEVTADLLAGTYDGAGLLLQWGNEANGNVTGIGQDGISFLNEADTAGYVGNNGYRRSWSLYIDTGINGSINRFALYAMANWDGWATARSPKVIIFRTARFRPATAPEIAAQRADANASTALAQIGQEASTRADAVSALTQEVDEAKSRVGTVESDISDVRTTAANDRQTAAQAVSQLTSVVNAAPNLIADVTQWQPAPGMGHATSGYWGEIISGAPPVTGSEQLLATSPIIPLDGGTQYCVSADLLCNGSDGSYAYVDFVALDSGGNVVTDSPQTASYASQDFSDQRARSVFANTAVTASGTIQGYARLIGYVPNGGSATLGIRKPKLERGSAPTTYTQEGGLSKLSAGVQVLQGTTIDLANRIGTAVFQVLTQAGNSRGLLKVLSDAYGLSEIDLVANAIHLFGLDGTTAIEALSVDGSGKVTIPNLAVGQIFYDNVVVDAFRKVGGSTWSGALTPGAGQSQSPDGFSFTLPGIRPGGWFLCSIYINLTDNTKSSNTSTYNGKPLYTTYMADYTLKVGFKDGQGNYYELNQGPNLVFVQDNSTSNYDAVVQAVLTRGSQDTGIVNEGDYYDHQLSATPTLHSISIAPLRWSAF
jgi:hypothetical protein